MTDCDERRLGADVAAPIAARRDGISAAQWLLSRERLLAPDPAQRRLAAELYETVESLPLLCPHGHVDPGLLADPGAKFGSPADLLVTSDHYVTRMLYSQGIRLEDLGPSVRATVLAAN
jgi:glucuronate isomerase